MSKQVKSQWEFGELFPAKEFRKVFSVGELTAQIRGLLEGQIGVIWVTGEVTNLKTQGSGHIYFTLKDTNTQLGCVLFRGEYQVDRSLLVDGRKITVQGELTVYEPRGQYQLRVTHVELEGIGALQIAFERLKQKLQGEGLFAQERKRPLPQFPQRIGLVTSKTGAAIRDVVHVIQRRNPALELILVPCRVQGEGAGFEIAAAIRLLNLFNKNLTRSAASGGRPYLDLILLTRGGGSLEDLWAFNEEIVARAIFESELPVVSAVGHEIDFTISDFVADLRAATPSAAAEIITEGVYSACRFVSEARIRLAHLMRRRLTSKQDELDYARERLSRLHPRRRIGDFYQRLDDLQGSMRRCVRQELRQLKVRSQALSERLMRVRPSALLKQRRELLAQICERLSELVRHRLSARKDRLASLCGQLKLLGPEQVLARGYSITMDDQGNVLRTTASLRAGQRVSTRLQAGKFTSTVDLENPPETSTG